MIGKIFITRSGYDPQLGRHVNDPYLGRTPTLGACRHDVRRVLLVGDHIFVISGKVAPADQFVMGGFEIAAKIHAADAYDRFPEHRLSLRPDGQTSGNVIVNDLGARHELDGHSSFDARLDNYIVGKNGIVLNTPAEIARGRAETLDALQDILGKRGETPFRLIGRSAKTLSEDQVLALRTWLSRIKRDCN